ncbi:MAG: signal peptidase I [Treponemataceae bacterium]
MVKNIYSVSYQLRKQLKQRIFFSVCYTFTLLVACNFFLSYIFMPVVIRSSSMEPTLEKNHFVLITPLISTALNKDFFLTSLLTPAVPIKRGDMVLVNPLNKQSLSFLQKMINTTVGFFTFQQVFPFSLPLVSHNQSVRRVLGFPGDTVFMRDYILHIRPQGSSHYLTEFEFSEKKYDLIIEKKPDNWDVDNGLSGMMNLYTLGENEYFLLADNRSYSSDSRIWGGIQGEDIKGKVLFRYFPFSKFAGF